MISWLIEEFIEKPPYIVTVSKKQLWWGNGIFNHAKYKKGLINALDLKVPSKEKCDRARAFYGYDVMRSPYVLLNGIINTTMKSGIINETIRGGKYEHVRVLTGRGYVRKDGTLDPAHRKGISCYVLFAGDHRKRDTQNEWLIAEPEWKRLQVMRNMLTHVDLLNNQIKSAKNKIAINEKLISQQEFLELNPGISKSEITWEDDE